MYPSSTRPTPFPTDSAWWKEFNKATGNPNVKVHASLAKEMQSSYCAGVGKLIWAMTTCCPDLAFHSVKLSQSNSCPNKIHYHNANMAYAYADLDWATCVKTCCSFGGSCLCLAGGTVAYKTQFQPTVAGSSNEAEYMSAYYTGKMILFVRSVLWDLGIP
jgi:hypothetical protein